MNILVVTQMYSQPDDVGENKPTKTVNYFAKEWVASGHRVVVMHCPSKFPIAYYLVPSAIKDKISGRISTMTPPIASRKELCRNENGIEVYRLPMLKFYPGQAYSAKKMQAQAEKISRILEEIRFVPEVIIGHFANPSTELVARLAQQYNAKSSIVFHHDCDTNEIAKYRIAENIRHIGAIGARSVVEAQEVQQNLHLKELPFVCCSGVPNDAVAAAAKICDKHHFENGITYLCVAGLLKKKNIDAVLTAFADRAHENDELFIVGGGPEAEPLQTLAANLHTAGKIVFTGRVSREEVLQYMKKAQVFALISDDEVYGMVYIEAMLQGCLVIASKDGGFDGIIKDGVNGFICNPGDTDMLQAIYANIETLTTEERNAIGQRAIDTAVHYSEREVAERYLNDVLKKNQ